MEILKDANMWSALSFVIFVVLVAWKARGTLLGALDARIERIKKQLSEAEELREEAQKTLNHLQRTQVEHDEICAVIIKEAKETAKAIRAEANQKYKENTERRERLALEAIAHAEAEAIADIRNRACELSIAAARNILIEEMGGKAGNEYIKNQIKNLSQRLQ